MLYIIMIISIVELQAIIASNPMGMSLKGTLDSIDLGRRFAKQIGCGDDDVACIRGKVQYTITYMTIKTCHRM